MDDIFLRDEVAAAHSGRKTTKRALHLVSTNAGLRGVSPSAAVATGDGRICWDSGTSRWRGVAVQCRD